MPFWATSKPEVTKCESVEMNINNSQGTDADSNTDNKSTGLTQFLPEKFGIRKAIEDSPYGWCYRESFLWGIATGTAMGIHRLRMKSHPLFAINIAFLTTITVTLPSYYFCYRKRDHQERVIEMMMAANDFRPGEEIPEQVPIGKDHPFLDVKEENSEAEKDEATLQKEFVARLKEKKEWQQQHQIQDADKIFKEKK
ncbi:hypothetical protein ACHAWT_010525 [Skeletonema menzelii]|mmetsp:Transcript_28282/g.45903  ORF Transcript_28282/g.45903 Transcript_28282/m.45903 type:complete len:197 (+) Transcript_28282:134-724(+)